MEYSRSIPGDIPPTRDLDQGHENESAPDQEILTGGKACFSGSVLLGFAIILTGNEKALDRLVRD
jgi:hypothetical protein